MEKLNRWIAKHAWLIYILSYVLAFLIAIMVINLRDDLPVIPVYIAMIAWIFACFRFAFSRCNVLLRKPTEILVNECDPYPFLEEHQRQRDYPGNSFLKHQRIVSEAMGLREIGEFTQACALLESARNEIVLRAHPINQVIYCSEMAYLSFKQMNLEEMEAWHRELMETYSKIKREKYRKYLAPVMTSHAVTYHFARKEYQQYLQALETVSVTTLRNRVVRSMSLANYHASIGETEKAKEFLKFVIDNGNRLHLVAEAKVLLEKINTEEQ